MNDRKNSFIMYNNYINYFTLLSYEDRGVLITAILEYANNRSVSIELEGAAAMAFAFIKDTLDRDSKKYEEKCEKNRENGKKGGRQRTCHSAGTQRNLPLRASEIASR